MKENASLHNYKKKHDYYFRFENDSHQAGEYQNYIEYFAVCMDKGITPKPDRKEGIHTLAIMEAMDESLRTGNIAKVSDILKRRHINL